MSSEPMKSLNALCAFLETKCACQPDGEDGVVECEPCSWVGAIQLLVAKHARCVEDNVEEQAAHGETLIELEAAASRERELEAQLDDEKAKVRGLRAELGLVKARVELAEARVAELERDAKQARDLLRRSRRYVIAHDYTRRGMLTGPPPVGGVLRDLIAAIDAAMAGEEP